MERDAIELSTRRRRAFALVERWRSLRFLPFRRRKFRAIDLSLVRKLTYEAPG